MEEEELPKDTKPSFGTIAGITISRWLSGDKERAVDDYSSLSYDGKRFVDNINYSPIERKALLALKAEAAHRNGNVKN